MVRDHILGGRFPAFFQNIYLFGNIAEPANDFLIAIKESENGVRNASVTTELQNQILGATEIVARDPGEKMVNSLELQAAVEEIKPGRAVDVHSGAKHFLGEGFVDSKVGGRHGEVGEGDLHM